MTEYIERGKVMDALLHEQYGYLCEDVINTIPAADVQPVAHGKWTEHQRGNWTYVKCSRCEAVNHGCTNFCPTCGADMRECET